MIIFLYTLSISLMILFPIGLAVAWRRRFVAPWWLFLVGVVTFAGSQAYHIPLNNWLMDLGVIGAVAADAPDFWMTAVILGLSAGLSESVARAVGYWFLFRRQRSEQWSNGVMVGLGHGGIEAMMIGGVFTAASVTSLWALRDTDLSTLGLSVEQLTVVQLQLDMFLNTPGAAFLGLAERLIAVALHVILSLLVWQAFKRRNAIYFLLAVAYHAAFDGTAVYLSQQIWFSENIWALEGILLLGLVPGFIWLWRSRPQPTETVRRRLPGLSSEWRLFGTAVAKELKQQWRTKRVLIVSAVFLLFGLGSPLIANFTPQILRSVEGAEQFADLIPVPTVTDSLTQYIKNITQFGFILAIILGMGAVAGEKDKGITAMILSKPMPRWAFILSKFVAQALVYLLAFVLAALGAYYYTIVLFGDLAFAPFLFGNFLLLVWLLAYTAVTLLGSTIARSTSAAAGVALVGSVVLLVAGSLPNVGQLAPSGLVAWASQLGLDVVVPPNGGALAMTAVLIAICLLTAVAVFETQEL